jgi:hypothetical protein
MGSYDRTRAQIRAELKNPDLRRLALQLADVIERMSNISSNGLESGIHSFDRPELAHMVGGVLNFLQCKDVESTKPEVRCDLCRDLCNGMNVLRSPILKKKDGSAIVVCDVCLNLYGAEKWDELKNRLVPANIEDFDLEDSG